MIWSVKKSQESQSSYSKVIEKEYHDLKVKKTFDGDGDGGEDDANW